MTDWQWKVHRYGDVTGTDDKGKTKVCYYTRSGVVDVASAPIEQIAELLRILGWTVIK